ncbi:MAG TPA: protein-L-isoaspartate O-methyltransferase [Accumulibacter sp.]|nr:MULTISPECIES: protein-L-isoaspartate O-methyltransferase [Candidatus Accumulibacter]MCC2869916.1 protein-L-isoaspartate O-methyltransferase [Candidatus Accumulibacter phosphatis]MBL8399845.1 protein-L-isoaspartate O-methyltransferase [Accumulibacter sp.]MBN8517519.1 protein-L-isoaspartate O-methyltransferase [Accumulibacter sp.]MBO3711652.1 protein-L-isoaspartate O-methyltransferase [Accumulibacter sp.]MCM8620657.1 protein-L-isoaspartate O-methyltransferase [Accumulibacter sp.]
MDMEQARFNMIEQQIRPWEVLDPEVLGLLAAVKREVFVPEALTLLAFADLELPIGHGQTMLPPKIEARILQEVGVRNTDIVLEVGTGSGHMAALLASKAEYVHSVEIDPVLAEIARRNLRHAGVANVSVETGDASQGWSGPSPYDVIVISGSLPELPDVFLQQLKLGGRLAAFIGEAPVMEAQLIIRTADKAFNTINLFETVVAPLTTRKCQSFVF